MKKGIFAALIVALVIALTSCSKPNLSGVADGVIVSMNGVSTNMSTSLNGGFTRQEMDSCSSQSRSVERLRLSTNAIVNINISSKFFSLYTEEHSFSDFDEPTLFEVDLEKNTFKYYTRDWKGNWDQGTVLELFFVEQKDKKTIDIYNPFQIARRRLGVRLGMKVSVGGSTDPSHILSTKESEAVFCAAALNTQYELLLRNAYTFKE